MKRDGCVLSAEGHLMPCYKRLKINNLQKYTTNAEDHLHPPTCILDKPVIQKSHG